MNGDGETKLNLKDLTNFMKALKGMELPMARVGILGDKTQRKKEAHENTTLTNADIGAKHEYGDPASGVPERSFLRIPITDHLTKQLQASGALDKEVLRQVVKDATVVPWLKKVAIVAEGVVIEAFATGGYGKWKPHAPGYTNNTGMILVDTQQLRNSITSEVSEK